jgi:hypothetical protein
MAKQTINLGTAPTGAGGDTPRSAFTKAQANFDELYGITGGLGTAATRNVGTGAGNLLERGAFGLGAASAQGATFTGVTGFSTFPSSASPVPGAGGSKITQNVGGNLFSEFVIVADSASSPTVAVRQYDANGSPGPWNKFYTTGNTTRAADGTLKAT